MTARVVAKSRWYVRSSDGNSYRVGVYRDGRYCDGTRDDAIREWNLLGESQSYVWGLSVRPRSNP